MSNFPGKGKVAVLKTTPETVLEDIEKLIKLAGVEQALPKDVTTGLKINISWQTWYPACSTTPWQLEGTIKTLKKLGYNDLVGIHNDTVVVDTSVGEINNKHRYVTDKYGIPCTYLYQEQTVPGPRQGLSRGCIHPQNIDWQEHCSSANSQDPCVHDHHRCNEKCLRRFAAPQSTLDAQCDP